jgi:hypothetical protein
MHTDHLLASKVYINFKNTQSLHLSPNLNQHRSIHMYTIPICPFTRPAVKKPQASEWKAEIRKREREREPWVYSERQSASIPSLPCCNKSKEYVTTKELETKTPANARDSADPFKTAQKTR